MTPDLDPTPRTPDEAERLARANEELDEARAKLEAAGHGLAAGVKVELGFMDDEQTVAEIAKNEAAVFVTAKAFTFERVAEHLPHLPVAEVEGLDWLRNAVMRRRVTCDYYGIGHEIEDVPVPLFVHFRLRTLGLPTPLYVTVAAAPEEWLAHALRRVVVAWPLEEYGRPFIATGPMRQFPGGIRVAPDKVGRNDPCPCGSGEKAKRCCLR